jgi:hypothetical protein
MTRVNRVYKIHKQKCSKIKNNRKIEKSLQVAQKRGTKILQVPNPAEPLRASNGDKSVQKAGCDVPSIIVYFGDKIYWVRQLKLTR